MRGSWRISMVAGALTLVSLIGTILTLLGLDRIQTGATLKDVLYISSPRTLKRMSLGYDGLMADIYWTRAVQYFGGKHRQDKSQYELLAPLLDITTTLDPHLIVAYEFGSNFLSPPPPNGAGLPDKAVDLVERGIRSNPQEWRLYYNLGFIHYMERKDYAAAADAFARGSEVPRAHPWLKVMAGEMATHAGDTKMARMMWSTTYDTTQDKMIKANAAAHLRALKVDDDVSALESLIARYRLLAGRPPSGFNDLIGAGMLQGIPVDPFGAPYLMTRDGRIEVRDPDKLPFIRFGLPLGYVPPKVPKILPSD